MCDRTTQTPPNKPSFTPPHPLIQSSLWCLMGSSRYKTTEKAVSKSESTLFYCGYSVVL